MLAAMTRLPVIVSPAIATAPMLAGVIARFVLAVAALDTSERLLEI